jgi:hypothetical protein
MPARCVLFDLLYCSESQINKKENHGPPHPW